MTTLTLQPALSTRQLPSPWLVAFAVVIPTFMEVLDTTIANVALRYIAGSLSSPATDSEWIVTSYLVANAIILPISGWLALRLGRRRYFLASILIFTLASVLCGMAVSLPMLIAARILQGLAGGGLQPSSQGVLLDAFPRDKQGTAQAVFGIAALLAPVVGPTLGGYITDNYGWRWIFFINVPVGLLALFLCNLLVRDPDYITAARKSARETPHRFDTIGLGLLAVTMASFEVILSKGQEWDWLGDPSLRVQTLLVLFLGCLLGLVWHELRSPNPLINFRTLRDTNFRWCCVLIFVAFAVLYANTVSLPALLQSLLGYDATTSGMVFAPAGFCAILTLVVVGKVLGRGTDARYVMAVGLLLLAAGNYMFSRLNLDISPWDIVWPRAVLIVGLSMIFAPLNVAAFRSTPTQLRPAAIGLLALLRNEGGSVGTSLARTLRERREHFHGLRLNEHLTPLNHSVTDVLRQSQAVALGHTGDPHASSQISLELLQAARDRQAASLAYLDLFWVCAVAAGAVILLLPLMRRSKAAAGAHIAAE